MAILDKELLSQLDTMKEDAAQGIKFTLSKGKLVAKRGSDTFKFNIDLSLADANKIQADADDPMKIIDVVCDNPEPLRELPTRVFSYLFEAYTEALNRVQGAQLGE